MADGHLTFAPHPATQYARAVGGKHRKKLSPVDSNLNKK